MRKIIKTLLLLFLVTSCSNEGSLNSEDISNDVETSGFISSSTEEIEPPFIPTEKSDNLEAYMINNLKYLVNAQSTHYLTTLNNNGNETKYVMYLDYQIKLDEYAYQKYSPSYYVDESSLNNIGRSSLYEQANYYNAGGVLVEKYLSIGNHVRYKYKMENGMNVEYQTSGYLNMFKLLTPEMFDKKDNNTFEFKSFGDQLVTKTIGYNLLGKNAPRLQYFRLITDGYRITNYEAEFEYFSSSTIMTYTFDGVILEDVSNVDAKFVKPVNGQESALTKTLNEKLVNKSYSEKTSVYLVEDRVQTLIDQYNISRDDDVILYNDAYYYYRDNDGYLFNVREFENKGYYNNEAPLMHINALPDAYVSSLTLKEIGNNIYSYEKGQCLAQYMDLSDITFLYEGEVNNATFTLTDQNIQIESFVKMNNKDFRFVTNISRFNLISHPFEKDDVKADGSDLTFSDLLSHYSNLSNIKDIVGGEELFNGIPVLGGYHNSCGVDFGLDPSDDMMIQITYYLASLMESDFDGCGSISEYDYTIFLAIVDEIINNYALKYDTTKFDVTDEGNRSYKAVSKESYIKDNITHKLEIEFYIGFDANYDAYLVIDVVFKPVRHMVTFNYMTPGEENLTLYIKEGDTPSVKDPTRSGYAFMGWYYDREYRQSADPMPSITKAITFYAKWEKRDDVTITFDYNYIGSPAPFTMTIPYGSIPETIPEVTRSGYTFYAWAYDAQGSGPAIFYSDIVTSSITVYAVWVEA